MPKNHFWDISVKIGQKSKKIFLLILIDSQSDKRNGAVRMEDSSIPTVHILGMVEGSNP